MKELNDENITIIFLSLLLFCGVSFYMARAEDMTVPQGQPDANITVDLNRYAGVWYELYDSTNDQQDADEYKKREGIEGICGDIKVTYTPQSDGTLRLVNECREQTAEGKSTTIEGSIRSTNAQNTILKVTFDPLYLRLFSFDYWILWVDPDYKLALLGSPKSFGYTVLSRTTVADPKLLEQAKAIAYAKGYKDEYTKMIPQSAASQVSSPEMTPGAKKTGLRKSEDKNVQKLRTDIIALAQSFSGQADPDYSKQQALEILVAKLLAAAPQPPVKERLDDLYGTWKQVWGPYDYRHDESRAIDPELGIDEIYQSVFPGGYYYNISPIYRDGDRGQMRTGLLRGEYERDDKNPNRLNVHFTSYRGIQGRPADGAPIWTLAPVAEADALSNETSIVPWLVVRLFFGTGSLDEIYTDAELRILYGSNGKSDAKKALYIMTKVYP